MPIIGLVSSAKETAVSVHAKIGGTKRTAVSGWTKRRGAKRRVLGIPEGLLAFTLESTQPGWVACNSDVGSPADLEGYLLRGAESFDPDPYGSDTHQHDAFSGTSGSDSSRNGSPGVFNNTKTVPHTHTYNHTHPSISHAPLVHRMRAVACASGLFIPSGHVLFWSGEYESIPVSWEYYSSMAGGRFIRVLDAATGQNQGALSHTHTLSTGVTSTRSSSTQSGNAWTDVSVGHNHSIAVAGHGHLANNEPPSIDLIAIETTGKVFSIESGIVAFMIRTTVPYGWSVYDPGVGYFIRCMADVDETPFGSETHNHGTQAVNTGAASAYGVNNGGTAGSSYPNRGHTHAMSHGHSDLKTIVPTHKYAMICRKD